MKIKSRVSLLACLLVVVVAPAVDAETPSLDSSQIELVRSNCVSVQSNMQRMERVETVTRRNRGVGYETTLRLMASLNSRVAANKLNAPGLLATTSQMEKKMNDFDKNYMAYNATFRVAMKLPNCQQQPVTFYEYLNSAREARVKVNTTVEEISQLLDEYQKNFVELKTQISATEATP